ncbi:MAG TPA: phytanoyl-CoA dioxygenase family protein [Opitutaceae bacterium]|nr:phytanoyl-CoA dioxygenase family protein [Opitutaceae bacterium]
MAQQQLAAAGWTVVPSLLRAELLAEIGATAFGFTAAGRRCLLDIAPVAAAAVELRENLARIGVLPPVSAAIQAIGFDKRPDANWKVTWHQDLLFPMRRRPVSLGFVPAQSKDGVEYARPPVEVLQEMLAVRLHLDDCGPDNGPLRVAPGSHLLGILPASAIPAAVARLRVATCCARRGELLLMRPLSLHASSPSHRPVHRRVLHFVYHHGAPTPEAWYRAV